MSKSVSSILNELTRVVEELRAEIDPEVTRERATAPRTPVDLGNLINRSDDLKEICAEIERHVIDRVMRKVRGNQSNAAPLLNISRGNLIAKLKQYGIQDYRHLPRTERAVPGPSRPAARGPRRSSLNVKALRVLQGKFLFTLRGLKPRQRERIKKVRIEKGYEAALEAAAELGK